MNEPVKTCASCKWHSDYVGGPCVAVCTHSGVVDVDIITGDKSYTRCIDQRSVRGSCGVEGSLYEPYDITLFVIVLVIVLYCFLG